MIAIHPRLQAALPSRVRTISHGNIISLLGGKSAMLDTEAVNAIRVRSQPRHYVSGAVCCVRAVCVLCAACCVLRAAGCVRCAVCGVPCGVRGVLCTRTDDFVPWVLACVCWLPGRSRTIAT